MKTQPKTRSFTGRHGVGAGGVPSLKSRQPDRAASFPHHPRKSADFDSRSFADLKPPVRLEPRPWFKNPFFWVCLLFLITLIVTPLVFVKSKNLSAGAPEPTASGKNDDASSGNNGGSPENNSIQPPESEKSSIMPPQSEKSPPSSPLKPDGEKSETSGLSLTPEEILLLEALRARENGNLKQAKEKIVEWLKLSPNSRDAKRLLAEINAALNSR
jgi:hypothetical protein